MLKMSQNIYKIIYQKIKPISDEDTDEFKNAAYLLEHTPNLYGLYEDEHKKIMKKHNLKEDGDYTIF